MNPSFEILRSAAYGMDAQRQVLDVDAENVALSQTASPAHPVRAQQAIVEPLGDDEGAPFEQALSLVDDGGQRAQAAVRVTPGAWLTGGDAVTEMVGVLDAQRAYEADASIFETGKSLISRTIDLERS